MYVCVYIYSNSRFVYSSVTAAASTLFSCIGSAVSVTYGHMGTVGNWNIYLSKPLNRLLFINRFSKEKTCNMPQEVRGVF